MSNLSPIELVQGLDFQKRLVDFDALSWKLYEMRVSGLSLCLAWGGKTILDVELSGRTRLLSISTLHKAFHSVDALFEDLEHSLRYALTRPVDAATTEPSECAMSALSPIALVQGLDFQKRLEALNALAREVCEMWVSGLSLRLAWDGKTILNVELKGRFHPMNINTTPGPFNSVDALFEDLEYSLRHRVTRPVVAEPASWATTVEREHERACMDITTAALEVLRVWANHHLQTTTRVTWLVFGESSSLKVTWRSGRHQRRQVVEVSGHLQSAIREARAAIETAT